jgi:hypothetical protein
MDFEALRRTLAAQGDLVRGLVAGLSEEETQWKPAPDRWSVLEVVCHLLDEERHDFRVRLDILLHKPGQPWPEIRPMEWVTERQYNTRRLAASLDEFLEERRASLQWLDMLDSPDWESGEEAPWGGVFHAGVMFAAWVFHGELHMQQLVRLRQDIVRARAAPYDVAYAGELS